MLGAEGLSVVGSLVIQNAIGEMDIVSALMFPVIFGIVWALPLMLAGNDLE